MKKSHLWILIFNAIYLLGFFIYYVSINNYEFVWYIFVIVIIGTIIGLNLKQSRLSNGILWMLSIWGILHMVAGGFRIDGTTLYSLKLIKIFEGEGQFYILKMDQVVHFYGFFVCSFLIYQLLKSINASGLKNPKLMIFISWLGSMGLGALNEIIEFIAFVSLNKTGVGDLYNTGLDLIFNMFGALVGAFLAHKLYKNKNNF